MTTKTTTTETDVLVELIPDLPEELGLECLTRLHYSTHGVSSRVCRRWRDLIQSKDFYYHRKNSGFTRKSACLVQALPVPSDLKPVGQPRYGISLFDFSNGSCSWVWVNPVPKYPDGLPLFCQVVSSEGKLVLLGGWDPSTWEPVKDVFLYDFTTQRWAQCADMPSATARSFFAVGAVEGKIVVAGGHDESKNALSSALVFDVKTNEWSELAPMSEERDECECVVIGSEFWVVSGYDTESQGVFKSSAEVYDFGSGGWRRVEDAWRVSRCPRSCVGVERGKSGNSSLFCWAESESAVQVGACGVDLGEWTLVTGSPYQGAPQGFFLMERRTSGGQKGKLVKIDVPDDFSGVVQSGCCVQI